MKVFIPYGSRQEPVAGSCEYGDELSGSIKSEAYIYQLSDYKLVKNDYVCRSF